VEGERESEDGKEAVYPERRSLWRELRVTTALIVLMLLEPLNATELSKHLYRLSGVCSDSKRKRLPQLFFFNSA